MQQRVHENCMNSVDELKQRSLSDVWHSLQQSDTQNESAGSLGWPFPMVEYSVYFSNKIYGSNFIEQHTHTHTRLTAPLPGLPR